MERAGAPLCGAVVMPEKRHRDRDTHRDTQREADRDTERCRERKESGGADLREGTDEPDRL